MPANGMQFKLMGRDDEARHGRFAGLDRPGLAHGVSTAAGPDFGVPLESPAHTGAVVALARAVGLDAGVCMRQVHGGQVLEIDRPGIAGEADAMVTLTPGLALVGRSADCPLVMIAGPVDGGPGSRVAGIAHASWRSTVQGIGGRMLERALALSGLEPARLAAAIAPSAGPCCYEVGPEVEEQALSALGEGARRFFGERGGRRHLDLWAANIAQLTALGIPETRIEVAGVCTICDPAGWPSWRREGEAAGRFAAAIGWRRD